MFRATSLAVILFVIVSLQGLNLFAQTGFVQNYIAESRQNKTYLRWTIIAGNTCNGIEIFRSTDGVNYVTVSQIFGICGNQDSAQTFLYTDNNPEKNKTNFYKLAFGYQGQTAVQSVFVLADGEVILYPNPATNISKLYFENNAAAVASVNLYDLSGKLVTAMSTKTNRFEINTAGLQAGLYVYVLTTAGKEHKGKLSIVH